MTRKTRRRIKRMLPYAITLAVSLCGGFIGAWIAADRVDAYIGIGWLIGIIALLVLVGTLSMIELWKALGFQTDKNLKFGRREGRMHNRT